MSGNSWRVSGINKESDAGAGTHGCTGGMTVTSCIACVSLGLPVCEDPHQPPAPGSLQGEVVLAVSESVRKHQVFPQEQSHDF